LDPLAAMRLKVLTEESAPIEYEQLVEQSSSQWIQLAATVVCVAIGVAWVPGMGWANAATVILS
jgi:hypothetical protein